MVGVKALTDIIWHSHLVNTELYHNKISVAKFSHVPQGLPIRSGSDVGSCVAKH